MIDSNSQFFAILTAVGEAKQANATALGTPWTFKEMAVGDANGTDPIPNKAQTKLINEWRRAPVNQVRTDPANPNIIITEQVIPPDVGGRWIREIGLFDADGDLVAVANCAPSFKPLLVQGTGKTQVIRMNFIVANTAQIVLKIDPAVVLATRQYVDDSLAAALPADKVAGTYRQVTISKKGIVVSGTNPTTLSGYGITNAVTKTELSEELSVKANKSTTLAGYGIADAFTKPETSSAIQEAVAGKADKASTLGGYGITDGMQKGTGGIGVSAAQYVADLNSIQTTGMFRFGIETKNRPPNAEFGTVDHVSYDQASGNWTQHAIGTSPRRSWIRSCINGAIQSWVENWNTENFSPSMYLQTSQLPRNTAYGGGWWRCGDTGLILQWGGTGNLNSSPQFSSFPMSFPAACVAVIPIVDSPAPGLNEIGLTVTGKTNSGFSAVCKVYAGASANKPVTYIAIGF